MIINTKQIFSWLILSLTLMLVATYAWSVSSPADIHIKNDNNGATIALDLRSEPSYSYFILHSPERLVVDIKQREVINGLPLTLAGNALISVVRHSTPKDTDHVRLVFELRKAVKEKVSVERNSQGYQLLFTLGDGEGTKVSSGGEAVQEVPIVQVTPKEAVKPQVAVKPNVTKKALIVVAIDAGHGGKDSGAVGKKKTYEKNVTLAISKKLEALLKKDKHFHPVLTRDGDYFISVRGRSDIARQKKADVLVSIHADSAPNRSARGASVWVLSNRRANNEMGSWLEQHEKQSELLGGAGDALNNADGDIYLSQAVLDLQFGNSQRVGYAIAVEVLAQLSKVAKMHKRLPEHASLGVLRSPDIPSLLVETGFISNPEEEKLLNSNSYQNKVAQSIYKGLTQHFINNPLHAKAGETKVSSRPALRAEPSKPSLKTSTYTVKSGDVLSMIAQRHNTTSENLRRLNGLKNNNLRVGQVLKVTGPAKTLASKAVAPKAAVKKVINYTVKSGDVLSTIAQRYRTTSADIRTLNGMKNSNLMVGKVIKVQDNSIKYTVKSGDVLSLIARKQGVTTEALQRANNLKNNTLRVGQILVIPK